ncbi:MAG: aminoglycoside phosphotransferase family protein [Trueperaceae bacterium]|nr:aminoglycoside phosphotransferase family protein [Trueperaceae bacterium]
MLLKPDIADELILDCLKTNFALQIKQLDFLPLGGDLSTAVYQATANDDSVYFCKLRLADYDPISTGLPKYLHDQGVSAVVPPLVTIDGKLAADMDTAKLILYPYIEGVEGYTLELSEEQWFSFGKALQGLHTLEIPESFLASVEKESYTPEWRERCKQLLRRLENETFEDSISLEMLSLLASKQELMLHALDRADQLAILMAQRSLPFVLCHSDIHPGNLHITPKGKLYIVDWDYPMLAPKERDLMFIGGGQGFMPFDAEHEEKLFYKGYGSADRDPMALAYYRYERGITEITVEAERVLSPSLNDQDRARALTYIGYYFLPGATLERAIAVDQGW